MSAFFGGLWAEDIKAMGPWGDEAMGALGR